MRQRALLSWSVVGALVSGAAVAARAQDADTMKPVAGPTAEPSQPEVLAPTTPGTVAPEQSSVLTRDPFALDQLTVLGDLPRNAASSEVVRARDFALRPIRTPSDLLRLAPGLHTAQHQGGGKADQLLLRGFDADHGTDVAIFVDGLPVNLRTHAHGQGWADIHWVIPEFIERVEIRKGTYFSDLGDFATAGAIRLVTKDALDGDDHVYAKVEAGSFDTGRVVLGLSPIKDSSTKTLVGGEMFYTDGATLSPQRYVRGSFFGKASETFGNNAELSGWLSSSSGDWSGSGQIPLRAVRNHTLDEFGAVDDSEGGHSSRSNAHVQFRYMPDAEDLFQARAYGSNERLRLDSNFHFFENDPVRGDEQEQVDQRWLGGGDFRFEHVWKLGQVTTKLSVGIETRTDVIDLKLAHDQRRRRFENVVSVDVTETSVSAWTELEVSPLKGLRVIGGVRDDHFWYTVRDHENATTAISGNKNDFIPQGKGGIVLGPFKSDAPGSSTEIYANAGSGFHSNDARVAVQTNATTLPQAMTYEVGFRSYLFDRLDLAADLFVIDLEQEFTFNSDDGTFGPSGRTRRMGGELEVRLRLIDDWLWYDADVTYTEGRFTRTNLPIPLAPRLLVRTGLTLKTPVGFEANLECRYLGKRPLDDAGSLDAPAEGVFTLVLRYIPPAFKNVELFARIENLFDTHWREAQFADTSRLPGEPAPVQDIHFTPGVPLSVVGGIAVKF